MIKSRLGDSIDFEAVKKMQEEATNWYATCPKCGVHIEGTLAQMRAHKCQIIRDSE